MNILFIPWISNGYALSHLTGGCSWHFSQRRKCLSGETVGNSSIGFRVLVGVLAVLWEADDLRWDDVTVALVAMSHVRLFGTQTLAQDLLEGEAKVSAEEGVDARVDGWVAVAQPEEDREQHGRDALRTKGPHHVHREERHPAHNESTHDDTQSLGRLRLHLEALHLSTAHTS